MFGKRTLIAGMLAVSALTGACASETPDRQQEIAARGAEVMPFDLDRTTHEFRKTGGGGVQSVTVHDPEDTEQIRLIREHLRKEEAAFRAGDFDDPAQIHGEDMPGVEELRAGYSSIEIAYRDLPDGARLTYATDDKVLATALHRWFDAQVSDHGEHAHGS